MGPGSAGGCDEDSGGGAGDAPAAGATLEPTADRGAAGDFAQQAGSVWGCPVSRTGLKAIGL